MHVMTIVQQTIQFSSLADQLDSHEDRELIQSLRESLKMAFICDQNPRFDVLKLANLFQSGESVCAMNRDLEPTNLEALSDISDEMIGANKMKFFSYLIAFFAQIAQTQINKDDG